MGYFANGTEGDIFIDQWCSRCHHWKDAGDGRGVGCPVWDAHIVFQSLTRTEEPIREILDLLISPEVTRAADGEPLPVQECMMFVPRDAGAAIQGQTALELGE